MNKQPNNLIRIFTMMVIVYLPCANAQTETLNNTKPINSWVTHKINHYTEAYVKANDNQPFIATIFQSASRGPSVGFVGINPQCVKWEDNPKIAHSSVINGVDIQMDSQCLGDERQMFFPRTYNGGDYLLNAFINGNYVIVNNLKFSAANFTASFNKVKQKYAGL